MSPQCKDKATSDEEKTELNFILQKPKPNLALRIIYCVYFNFFPKYFNYATVLHS